MPPQGAPAGPPGGPVGGAPGAPGAAPKKKGGAGAIIGIVAALAVVGGLVAVYMMFFAGAKSELSKSFPKDTEVFLEIPDVKSSLGAMAGMDIVNEDKLDSKKWSNEIRDGLTDAFDIKKDAAEDLMESIDSVGIGMRDLSRDEEGAFLISFSSADGMDKLLKSERFSKEDDVGSGARYEVERLEVDDPEEMSEWSAPKKAFAGMRYDAKSKRKAFVWFEDKKLLAIGHPDYIEDISSVIDGSDSLADSDNWKKAKFHGGNGLAFVSPELLSKVDDDDAKRFVKGYFSEVAPFAGSMDLTDAGVLITLTGEMRGNKIGEEDELASPGKLDLYEKLPEETIAYIAISTTKKEDGKAAKKWLVKKLKSIEENLGDKADEAFDAMDDEMGFKITELFDALGDSMVIAVAIDRKTEYDEDKKPTEYIEDAGIGYIIQIGDEDKAKKIVKKVKEKFFEDDGPMSKVYDVDDKGDGFVAEPKEENEMTPEIRVIVEKDYVLITAGGLAGRFEEAADKEKKTLADDSAHKTAIGSFKGDPRALVWVDTGWIGQKLLAFAKDNDDASEKLEDMEDETGFTPEAMVLKGDKRITSAMALVVESGSDHWDLKFQALNGSLLMAGSSAFFLLQRLSGLDGGGPGARPALAPPSSGGGGEVGIAECDAFYAKVEKCTGLPAGAKEKYLESKSTMRLAAQSGNKSQLANSCKQMQTAIKMQCP